MIYIFSNCNIVCATGGGKYIELVTGYIVYMHIGVRT